MASQARGLFHDQNLNVHYNGTSAGGKSNVSKAQRKGGLGGRKPLFDLSNSMKPPPNQSPNQLQKSKIKIDASKKKSFSKALEKAPHTSGRKALSDISNSGKLHVREASMKNLNAKLSFVAEGDLSAIAEEHFHHDHEECIKAQRKVMDNMHENLWTTLLGKGFPMQSPSQLSKLKPASPVRWELEEIPEQELEEPSASKYEPLFSKKYDRFWDPDSSPCPSPESPDPFPWVHDYVNFKLKESP